tara:strand:+ start:20174 stop:20902 length:729 start_codon:yes stop_codon:yes gene_type:complete
MKIVFNKQLARTINHPDIAQYNKTYQSTIQLYQYLNKNHLLEKNTNLMEIGCGIGAILNYLSQMKKSIYFTGGDYRKKYLKIAKNLNSNINNLQFRYMDWYNLDKKYISKFNGIISVHSLCCMKNLEEPINQIIKLKPNWFVIKSLFCEEEMDAFIRIVDHKTYKKKHGPDSDFNIFSLVKLKKLVEKKGYKLTYEKQFPFKKIKKSGMGRGTFTIKTDYSAFTQFSGPIHLPWYFTLCKKI